MTDDGMFPRSPAEKLGNVEKFVRDELGHRVGMLKRQPEKADYWEGRIALAQDALADVRDVKESLA